MISSFYESRFTADRLGGGKKCIDFVFERQWPLAAILRPNKTLFSVLLKTRIKIIPCGILNCRRGCNFT